MNLRALVVASALVSWIPRASAAEPARPPAVELTHLRLGETHVTTRRRSGGEAVLTLDPVLQRATATLLADARPVLGAVVAVDLTTGRLLVWATTDGANLLTIRAPSASVFKLVTTAALLELGHVHPRHEICTVGGTHGIERRHLDAPHDRGAQCGPFWQALGHSRNAVYAQLVTSRLARQDLVTMTERFGFNDLVPFDFDARVGAASVPVGDLDFARMAAGFEHTSLSPLGGLHLASVIATGGRELRFRIVQSAGDYRIPAERELGERILDERTAFNLRWMMEVTVHSGTSAEAFTDRDGHPYLGRIQAAGKTGTLQGAPGGPTSTWFVGFAPSRGPKIAVSVLVQNGKVWRRKANELARDVFRAYFARHGFRGVTDPLSDSD